MSNLQHTMTEKEIKEIWERLSTGESSLKSAHHRIDGLEKMADSVNNLAISVAKIADEMKKLREDSNNIEDELQELKDKPAQRWNTIVTAFLQALCGGVAGYLIALILK